MKTSRRKFVTDSIKITLAATLGPSLIAEAACSPLAPVATAGVTTAFQFLQVALPYEKKALEPYIDELTMDIHYTKHHSAYVKNVNDAIMAENIPASSEEEFFATISKYSAKARNNGGGAWNHNFFWKVMKPGSETPSGRIAEALNASFGSIEKFKEQFSQAALTRFASGWAWLVSDNGKLKIGSTPNQDNPLMDISELKGKPLLALDVWEHAYYLKYQNKRNEYIANWWNVVNWNEVAKHLP